ncbi:tetratricopeptide repeat protein [bacterium]|nr:tetratricopeptide repeat protein [bacterium]
MFKKTMLILLAISLLSILLFSCSKKVTSPPPKSASTLVKEGWDLFTQAEYGGAKGKFTEAIARDPDMVDAYNGRGWSLAASQEYTTAEIEFQQALAIDSSYAEALAGLGLVENVLNEYTNSIDALEKAISLDPTFEFSHNSTWFLVNHKLLRLVLAQSYYYLCRFEDAKYQLDLLDPEHAPHNSEPAMILYQIQTLWGKI